MKRRSVLGILVTAMLCAVLVLGVSVGTVFAAETVPEGLIYTVAGGKATVTGYTGSVTELVIPGTVEGCPVTAVAANAFSGNTALSAVTIPESLTTFGAGAFNGCTGLKAVYISNLTAWVTSTFQKADGVSAWLSNPLYYAKNLYLNGQLITELVIPEGVTKVSSDAFRNAVNIKSIVVPEGVTELGERTFMGMSNLVSVQLPDSLKSISGQAFRDCAKLPELSIPESVTSIGGTAFNGCKSLTELRLPSGITAISSYMFQNCSGLTGMTLPDEVTNIMVQSFENCIALTYVRIPAGVTTIGQKAFNNCPALTDVYFYGTQAQWDAITVASGNDYLKNAKLHIMENHVHSYDTVEVITDPTWTAEGQAKKTCSACGETVLEAIPVIAGKVEKWNITLTNSLIPSWHLAINEQAGDSVKVRITLGSRVMEQPVASLPVTEEGLYVVSAELAAAQMTEKIKVELLNGDTVSVSTVYTVRQYADAILAEDELTEYHALVRQLLHYGAAAQTYFDHNMENLADTGITGIAAQELPTAAAEEMSVTGESESVQFYAASLLYRDRITLRVYFTGDVTGCTFTANGKAVTPTQKDQLYYVEVTDILPQRLDRQAVVGVTAADGSAVTVRYSPLNYLVRMGQKGSEDLRALLKAVYNYYLAAESYVSAIPLPKLTMRYDDVLDLTTGDFGMTEDTAVSVQNISITSKQVGTDKKDTAVLTYDAASCQLWATATGTAKLTVGDESWIVTVEPAPISLFLIGGHSVSAGVGGNPAHSVVSQPGQVYSTYESYITAKADDSWGWEYNWSFSNTAEEDLQTIGIGRYAANRPQTIDALTEGNTGTYGSGSALAYEWNRLTGEKVWVINAGHGGMGLSEWREGAIDYVHASQVFRNAQIVLKNEIAAGHYSLRCMEFFYFSCANGDQTWFTEDYREAFLSMWNGFQNDFSMDMDGDGTPETLSAIGLVPHWRPSGQSFVHEAFNNGQSFNYFMAASEAYPDVFIASSFCRGFDRDHVSADAIRAFYTEDLLQYTLQDGTAPETLIPTALKGYTGNAVFPDQIHVAQLTQNVQGIVMARSLYSQRKGETARDVTLYKPYGINTVADGETITLNTQESFRISAMLKDAPRGELTFEVIGDAITAQGTYITAGKTAGTAQLLVKLEGEIIKTVNFNVVQPAAQRHTHCHCGGEADHTCDSDIIWTAWTSTTSLPTESGYYYLTADVNITGYANILNGNKVYLCLNGHSVNKVYSTAKDWVGRIYQISDFSQLTVCDCTGNGAVNGSSTNQNGGHFILLSGAKLNWYSGTLSRNNSDEALTSTTTYGGLIYVYDTAEVNLYGGTISGGKAGNGGSIYAAGTVNVYGGTLSGGTAVNGGNIYVADTGAVNLYGGTVENGIASSNGGNIHVLKKGKLQISGGVISGGNSTGGFGGNVYVSGSLSMTGGTVTGGTGTQGGNIMLSGGEVRISGGYILDGKTGNEGGNLKAIGGTATITGGVMAGGTAGFGGNIAIGGGAVSSVLTVHMTGGTVTGGTAGTSGGNVYIHNGAFNMSGGNLGGTVTVGEKTYSGGTATTAKQAYGGNVYILEGTLMQLSGTAVIENGSATTGGGNIYNAGFLKITGGTVSGGTAGTNGGNLNGVSGEIIMSGGTISGGTALQGGSINISGGTFTMSGGTLTGGVATHATNTNSGWGGNLYVKAPVLLKGTATLTGGYGQANGGNVHIAGGGSFTMNGTGVTISGGTKGTGTSNDLNQLKSSTDRTVELLRGTVGSKVYAEAVVEPTQTEFSTFVAGFGKADVTPFDPVYLGSYNNAMERRSTGVRNPFSALTTALTDTEGNTLLIIVTDLSWGHENQLQQVRAAVLEKYGIPGENVLLGGTHNHNGAEWYTTGWETPENQAYLAMWLEGVLESVETALADRKPAQLNIGRTQTDKLAFVRRYYCADGTVTGSGPQTYYATKLEDITAENPIVGYESAGDEEIQLVKITRDGGKDILIGQWQNHGSHDGATTVATTDWIGYTRSKVLANVDCEFMYLQGAAGNMSTVSHIAEDYTTKTTQQIGEAVADVIIAACAQEDTFTPVDSGTIAVEQVSYTDKNYWGNRTWTAELNAVAIGDLSVVTLPVELYAESGLAIKAGTPFDMTLIMGYTNGICGYVGTAEAVANGGYGIQDGRANSGGTTADNMVQTYLERLEKLFG